MSEPISIDLDRLIVRAKVIAKQRHGVQEQDIVAYQVEIREFSTRNKYIVVDLYTRYLLRIEVWFRLREVEDNVLLPEFDTSTIRPVIECF